MYFGELFPTDFVKTLETANLDLHDKVVDIPKDTRLVINLLPSHPFQYPTHERIAAILDGDIRALETVRIESGAREVMLLMSRESERFYSRSVEKLAAPVFFVKPFYPFLQSALKSIFGQDDVSFIGWFDLMCLFSKWLGTKLEGIPVSITKHAAGVRHITFVPLGVKVGEILNALPVRIEDFTVSRHPFKGEPLTAETQISLLEPFELLLLPKNRRERAGIFRRLAASVSNRDGRVFNDLCTTIPLDVGNPCQKCLRCSAICPVALHPFMLSAIAARGTLKDALPFNLGRCIECGLCTYVCPSGIPLTHNIAGIRRELVSNA
jgi:ferredoxin